MICKMVTYKVKEDKIATVKKAIKEFVRAVKNEPGTLFYDAYQIDDTSFIHFMEFKDAKAEQIHRNTEHVKKFVSILYPNCEEESKFTDLAKVE